MAELVPEEDVPPDESDFVAELPESLAAVVFEAPESLELLSVVVVVDEEEDPLGSAPRLSLR